MNTASHIIDNTKSLKRKRAEEVAVKEKRIWHQNWKVGDDLAFLKLVLKYKFSWDQVLHDLTKFEHRRTDSETEDSIVWGCLPF